MLVRDILAGAILCSIGIVLLFMIYGFITRDQHSASETSTLDTPVNIAPSPTRQTAPAKRSVVHPYTTEEFKTMLQVLQQDPPHYNLETVTSMLDARRNHFAIPSYGVLYPDPQGDILFQAVYADFKQAQTLEKAQNSKRALDYYIMILLTVVPLGDSYYLRPAILLERFKCYDAALAVCALRKYHIHRDSGQFSNDLKNQWKKREDRLKSKLDNCKQ